MSSQVLANLQPHSVWSIFESICNIPHASKHEAKIQEWVLAFAKEHGVEAFQDKTGNVILRKPATPGMENKIGVVMQSHLDMVPQKNNDTVHNFLTDPIRPIIEDGWVRATGTTLGADNGIGMAASLAVMVANNIEHGPLECLITYDEEAGMTGAFNLEPNVLKGDILLNLDTEDHGELSVGCAGGVNTTATIAFQQEKSDEDVEGYKIVLTGLKGGHSGLDIHLGRGNANKIMNRVLWSAANKVGLRIASVNGGSLRNAIPRESVAIVTVPIENKETFLQLVNGFLGIVKNELASTDGGVSISVEPANKPEFVMDAATQKSFLNAVFACPNGVYGMSADMPGLVETSNNLAIIKTEDNQIHFETLQRSSVESQKEDIKHAVVSVFELAGATDIKNSGDYPGWKPNMQSNVLKVMQSVYRNLFNGEPKLAAMHAGLECGLLGNVYPNWDMISFGPTIRSPHSPDEKVNIETVGEFWKYLVDVLKNIPEKK